jgi:hypothetical protein
MHEQQQQQQQSLMQSFADRVRAKIEALKRRGPKPEDLGSGAAERAGRAIAGRKRQIDRAVEEATR